VVLGEISGTVPEQSSIDSQKKCQESDSHLEMVAELNDLNNDMGPKSSPGVL